MIYHEELDLLEITILTKRSEESEDMDCIPMCVEGNDIRSVIGIVPSIGIANAQILLTSGKTVWVKENYKECVRVWRQIRQNLFIFRDKKEKMNALGSDALTVLNNLNKIIENMEKK